MQKLICHTDLSYNQPIFVTQEYTHCGSAKNSSEMIITIPELSHHIHSKAKKYILIFAKSALWVDAMADYHSGLLIYSTLNQNTSANYSAYLELKGSELKSDY